MILVTGGTGLVGSHLLYLLTSAGNNVRALYREDSDLNAVRDVFALYTRAVLPFWRKIQWVKADINDIPALEDAFYGVRQVYHLAAIVSFSARDKDLLYKTNVKGTANIVNISLKFGVTKLCYVSSVATLSKEAGKDYMDEGNFWNPDADNNYYAISKYGAEMEVWRGTQEGLSAVIVNPAVILGPSINGKSSSGIITQYATGARYYTKGSTGFVDVRDVVRIMYQLMDGPYQNENYVLVGENISYQDFTHLLDDKFKFDTIARPVAKPVVMTLAYISSFLGWLFRYSPKLNPATAKALFRYNEYANHKIRMALGFEFAPLEQTIDWIINSEIHTLNQGGKEEA